METKLRKFYALKTELYSLSRELDDITAGLTQAKYDQRQAKAAVLEYEGSFRSFLDKLSGMRDAHAEELTRTVRKAEAELSSLSREQEALTLRKAHVETELKALPTREEFLAVKEPSLANLLHRLDALLYLKQLPPVLEENYEALLAMRDQLQGKNYDRVMSTSELQDIYSRPDTAAEKCRKLLEQLESNLASLGISFPIPDYYRSPIAYINAAASNSLRRDRVNLALDQALAVKRQVSRLLEALD